MSHFALVLGPTRTVSLGHTRARLAGLEDIALLADAPFEADEWAYLRRVPEVLAVQGARSGTRAVVAVGITALAEAFLHTNVRCSIFQHITLIAVAPALAVKWAWTGHWVCNIRTGFWTGRSTLLVVGIGTTTCFTGTLLDTPI